MPKVSKQRKANQKNAKKGGHHQNFTKSNDDQNDDFSDDNNDSDQDFYCGPQPSQADNSSTSFIMQLKMLQIILDAASNCECNRPRYKIQIASFQGFNCHLVMTCTCGNQKRIWAAPENFDEACLLACKLSGIKQGQIQDFMTFMNFGYQNDNGQTFTINIYGRRLTRVSQELDIKLDCMKKADEQKFFNQILAATDTEVVDIQTDGMYPIRNNSGICVSSVMGSINGEKKIICE